jgi:hypothetical protein
MTYTSMNTTVTLALLLPAAACCCLLLPAGSDQGCRCQQLQPGACPECSQGAAGEGHLPLQQPGEGSVTMLTCTICSQMFGAHVAVMQ